MAILDDFRLKLGQHEFVPLMLGGMGVDISRPELALEVARLNGIAHISDAMIPAVTDRKFQTHFVQEKLQQLKTFIGKTDKAGSGFDLEELARAIRLYVGETMAAKRGTGGIFINIMEKLSMGNPRETLRVRLTSAMDAGIDGITLSAGLHLGSLELMRDHPRFRDIKLGVIVSSARALKLFLQRASRSERLPDYVVVEGPLAGGHLGFPMNWREFDLKSIATEVMRFLEQQSLKIPVIPAGGIFTGSDAVDMLEMGASAVQVATRFTVTKESGLPDHVKQQFFRAEEEDVVVNSISPTGYPMRMLRNSPAIGAGTKPNCEAFGYGLDTSGNCSYRAAYERAAEQSAEMPLHVQDKTCLCSQMVGYKVWTCGQTVSRLKNTTNQLPDGSYQQLTTEHVFRDYQFSREQTIALPDKE